MPGCAPSWIQVKINPVLAEPMTLQRFLQLSLTVCDSRTEHQNHQRGHYNTLGWSSAAELMQVPVMEETCGKRAVLQTDSSAQKQLLCQAQQGRSRADPSKAETG